jgi:hypothetical protein
VRHTEKWTLGISPDEGETWPVLPVRKGQQIQPDHIHVVLERGAGRPRIAVTGLVLKKGGQPGKNRMGSTFSRDVPDWVAVAVNEVRYANGLGVLVTECGS